MTTIDDATLTQMLAETLEDQRLSRSERRALKAVIADLPGDDATFRHRARARAFELARAESAAGNGALAFAWLEDVVKALWPDTTEPPRAFRGEAHFSPNGAPRDRLVRLLEGARGQVDICVFTITDNEVSRAITAACRRGVAVRVLSDDQKEGDLGSDIASLASGGIDVRLDRSRHHMHHKSLRAAQGPENTSR